MIHLAELTPTKSELIAGWLPSRPWARTADPGQIELVGAYRFDDPAGAVGIETHLVRTGDGQLLQVPLTYRGAPQDGADDFLVGSMEHSVLGRRWVYDGCGDAVYVAALARAILAGGREAEQRLEQADGRRERRESPAQVVGSAHPGVEVPALDPVSAVDAAPPRRSVRRGSRSSCGVPSAPRWRSSARSTRTPRPSRDLARRCRADGPGPGPSPRTAELTGHADGPR